MVGVTNPDEADFHIIIDKTTRHKFDPKKAIYISAHPTGYPGYFDPSPDECIASINYKNTSGFLEWWLNYDYDILSAMKCPVKTKPLICIMTTSDGQDYQKDRLAYMEEFCTNYPANVDVYGRTPHTGAISKSYRGVLGNITEHWYGKEILADYGFSLEFDAYAENYFSERIADALLMYCMPFYKGGTGLEKYIPKESFAYIGDMDCHQLIRVVQSDIANLKAIEEARYNILNKLQLWAKVYSTIKKL